MCGVRSSLSVLILLYFLVRKTERYGFHETSLGPHGCLSLDVCSTLGSGVLQGDPSAHQEFMDTLPATFLSYTGEPSSEYRAWTYSANPELVVYAPDQGYPSPQLRVWNAYGQGEFLIRELFEVVNLSIEVQVYIVQDITADPNATALATKKSGVNVILIEDGPYTEHSFLHEYMHIIQQAADARQNSGMLGALIENLFPEIYNTTQRWYVEGPPQFAPLITAAPPVWVNKDKLYNDRFSQAIRGAHGKSLTEREEVASLFWYYYFLKVHGRSRSELGEAMLSYRDSGFDHRNMDWFNFDDYWYDFALSHVNKPGDKTGIWETIDSDFQLITDSALDGAERIDLPTPFGEDPIEMRPLSQKYFYIQGLAAANNYVTFTLPDKQIPDGIKMSAILRRPDDSWESILLDESELGEKWTKRFPINGEKVLQNDASVAYSEIAFVISNSDDADTQNVNAIISSQFSNKYEGRGVEIESSNTNYIMTGTSFSIKPKTGDGFRLVVDDEEIHTRAFELWFRRDPLPEIGNENLDTKALRYIHDHGKFRGDVYFKFKNLVPEEVVRENSGLVEKGKWILNRDRKEDFYEDVPNRFVVTLDQKDLLIMAAGGGPKAMAAFTKQIEDVVNTEYGPGTFGHNVKQLFQQTIALDTRAYGQDYEITYERGSDENGNFLKIKLASNMWFMLREL